MMINLFGIRSGARHISYTFLLAIMLLINDSDAWPVHAAGSPQLLAPPPMAQLVGLGTELSWSMVPETTQVQIQVYPASLDGPSINLIRNAVNSYIVEEPVRGTGPYVMLPGMTYKWRIRSTSATTSVDESSPLWDLWSEERSFRTRPPKDTTTLAGPVDDVFVETLTPQLQWSNIDENIFYYEIQVSKDRRFGEQGRTAMVYSELVHVGAHWPAPRYVVPSGFPLEEGVRYYWRVRPRVQGDGRPANWKRGQFLTHHPVRWQNPQLPACNIDMAEQKATYTNGQKPLWGAFYKPSGDGPFPAMLVLHTAGGFSGHVVEAAKRLAAEGYVALAVDYYTPEGLPPGTHNHPTSAALEELLREDIARAVDCLKSLPYVRSDRVGSMGFSYGGHYNFYLATRPDIRAIANWYAGTAGNDVWGDAGDYWFSDIVAQYNDVRILLLHGDADTEASAAFPNMLKAVSILTQAGKPPEFHWYPGQIHVFDSPRTPGYSREIVDDAWSRTLSFLSSALGQ